MPEPLLTEPGQRRQDLMMAFGLFALRGQGPAPMLDEACRVAAAGLRSRFAKVLRFVPADGDFLMQAGIGWKPGLVGLARFGAGPASAAGHAFRTGRPAVSSQIAGAPGFPTSAVVAGHGIRRGLSVAIGDGEHAYGVLEVDRSGHDDFGQHDVAFLQGLADILAAALLRAAQQDAMLRQKDLMMQEVHHRVRNSLQLVHTLLQLQSRHVTDAGARRSLDGAALRVMTVAAVHKRLHLGPSILEADLVPYLSGLLDDLRSSVVDAASGRSVVLDALPATIPAGSLTSLGLVVAELVTNALKYGRGQVTVRVRVQARCLCVAVEDEGEGFPPGFDPAGPRAEGEGLGMRLVLAMARGRDALRVDRDVPFSRITVQLPLS